MIWLVSPEITLYVYNDYLELRADARDSTSSSESLSSTMSSSELRLHPSSLTEMNRVMVTELSCFLQASTMFYYLAHKYTDT